jgi:hypothetical protein
MSGGICLTGAFDEADGQITFTSNADSGFNTIYSGYGINFGTGSYWNWEEGIHVNGLTMTENGISFADQSYQDTAFDPAVLNNYLPITGSTLTGKLSITSTGTTAALFNLKTGITATSPVVGDIWLTTGSMRYKDSTGTERIIADTNRANTYTTNNTFQNSSSSPTVTITASGSGSALKITNTGTGDTVRIEDDTSPDATPFVINASGRVGIGMEPSTTVALSVDSTGIKVNGATLIPASTVTNSPSLPTYTKELLITINGVSYAIPLRVV